MPTDMEPETHTVKPLTNGLGTTGQYPRRLGGFSKLTRSAHSLLVPELAAVVYWSRVVHGSV